MEENYISEYLDFCESQKRLSLETIRAYSNDLNQFKKFDDMKGYVRYLCTRYNKSKTIRRKLACVKSYYRYLENENIIHDNRGVFITPAICFYYHTEKDFFTIIYMTGIIY